MKDFEVTKRTKIRRAPQRGDYDRETVYGILDEGLICHVGLVDGGRPVVIPTAHWRDGDRLYLHGSNAAGMMRLIQKGAEVCVTVTLLDGLVLARSGFHHSMNYRSVVLFGKPNAVTEAEEKMAALKAFMERIAPGRWDEVRPPNDVEMRQTQVVAIPLTEASAKIRTGPPVDDEEDYALPVWAGEVPLALSAGAPVADPRLPEGTPLPSYLKNGRGG